MLSGRRDISRTRLPCASISCRLPPGHFEEKNVEYPNTQRRAIGLLVLFATVLTLIAIWDLPETER